MKTEGACGLNTSVISGMTPQKISLFKGVLNEMDDVPLSSKPLLSMTHIKMK